MAKAKAITLGQLMSRFGIKAAELSELFGVTRQTVYNNREKNIKTLTKDNQSKLCQLCSVSNTAEIVEFYNDSVAADGKNLLKKNMAKLLKNNNNNNVKTGKTIDLPSEVSDEYCRLLEKLLKDRLSKGDDFDLLKIISKR